MKISTKGRYALRLMVDLSLYDTGEYVSLKDVAERQAISMKYLEQIVSQLTKAGYLHSVRGPQGGYKLARRPTQYTVGEILRVTEGNLAPVSCLEVVPNPCPRAEFCSTLPVWEGLYQHIADYVDGITLEDVVNNEKKSPDSDDLI
ncbi:Rrf2 family transcriptional regulator [Ruminococcaceae bacterium OttesenSCG-928-I18]|nr:Rrf2 family transcriptional regulator [Ruminococcaceae bacterium OttesenSCG-928-I18]